MPRPAHVQRSVEQYEKKKNTVVDLSWLADYVKNMAQDPASRFGHGEKTVKIEDTKTIKTDTGSTGERKNLERASESTKEAVSPLTAAVKKVVERIENPAGTGWFQPEDLEERGAQIVETYEENKPGTGWFTPEDLIQRGEQIVDTYEEAKVIEQAQDWAEAMYGEEGAISTGGSTRDQITNAAGTGWFEPEDLEQRGDQIMQNFQDMMLQIGGGGAAPTGHQDEILALLAEIARRYQGGSVYQQYSGVN